MTSYVQTSRNLLQNLSAQLGPSIITMHHATSNAQMKKMIQQQINVQKSSSIILSYPMASNVQAVNQAQQKLHIKQQTTLPPLLSQVMIPFVVPQVNTNTQQYQFRHPL